MHFPGHRLPIHLCLCKSEQAPWLSRAQQDQGSPWIEDLHLGWFCVAFGRLVQFRFGVLGVCFVYVFGLLLVDFLIGPLSTLYFFKSNSSTLQSNSPGAEWNNLPGATRTGKPLVWPWYNFYLKKCYQALGFLPSNESLLCRNTPLQEVTFLLIWIPKATKGTGIQAQRPQGSPREQKTWWGFPCFIL